MQTIEENKYKECEMWNRMKCSERTDWRRLVTRITKKNSKRTGKNLINCFIVIKHFQKDLEDRERERNIN